MEHDALNEFDRKCEKALTLLATSGIMKNNYLPPTFPVLWHLGLKVPPPHFLSFWKRILLFGSPFGLCWVGLCMASFEAHYITVTVALLGLLLAITLPGTLIASYYSFGRKRFHLPEWSDL